VLLFDEPLSALDAHTRERVRAELFGLLHELRLPALLVTHDFEDAAALADRVGVISRGRVLQMGTPAGLLAEPADAFVASFVGSNMMAGTARRVAGGRIEVVLEHGAVIHAVGGPDGPVGAVVHPWDVTLDGDDGGAGANGRNRLRAPVGAVMPHGDRVRVRVGPLVAEVSPAAADAAGVAPGRIVTATWTPEATRLVPR
jgi:molybdate transport system ATP-binding protein